MEETLVMWCWITVSLCMVLLSIVGFLLHKNYIRDVYKLGYLAGRKEVQNHLH